MDITRVQYKTIPIPLLKSSKSPHVLRIFDCVLDAAQMASVLILFNVRPDTIRWSHYLNLLLCLHLKSMPKNITPSTQTFILQGGSG